MRNVRLKLVQYEQEYTNHRHTYRKNRPTIGRPPRLLQEPPPAGISSMEIGSDLNRSKDLDAIEKQVLIKNSIARVLHGRLLRRRQCFAILLYPIQERLRYGT